MRIISGSARGTKLNTLEGLDTRPTLDRVKESLFNIIQDKTYGARVLDLFSGSGALALETLSRGAEFAYLCDNSKKAVQIIKENVAKTHFESKAKILNMEYNKAIEYLKKEQFDIIFLDPPYKTELDVEAIKLIKENNMLLNEGRIILETDRADEKKKILEKLDINIYDIRKYGRVSLFFLN